MKLALEARVPVMNRSALILAALMCTASGGAVVLHPSTKAADRGPAVKLETMVPRQFGDWREEPERLPIVFNPQAKELIDKLYSQTLTRTYANGSGYRIMLSLAYGGDQRAELQAHMPEVCYPAQGFKLLDLAPATLKTAFGDIPATRLRTVMGQRSEPVTYWFTYGDSTVRNKLDKRLVEFRYGLTGQIPDGLLFRVSSIDDDGLRAFRTQEQFVDALLEAVPAANRARLSGLVEPSAGR